MRSPFRALLACTLLLTCASRAGAQDLRRGLFDRYDANRDGRLSAEERADARDYLQRERGLSRSPGAGEPGGKDEDFHGMLGRLRARFDENGDGQLDGQEATKARAMWADLRDRTDSSTDGSSGEPRVGAAGPRAGSGGKGSRPGKPQAAGRAGKAPKSDAGRAPAPSSRAKAAPKKAGGPKAGRSPSGSKGPTARSSGPKSGGRASPQRAPAPSPRANAGGGKKGGAKAGGGRKKGGR